MSTVADIEKAISALPVQDARSVASWLGEYLEDKWDRQIEEDAKTGKLDKLADEALAEYNAGKARPLDEVIDGL